MVLIGILVRERPSLLVYGTPKAALLGAVAGTLTRAPVRVYVLHGLRLETLPGLRRGWMAVIEWFVMRLSTRVVAVSACLRELVIESRLVARPKIQVLGHGSSNGIDGTRFVRSSASAQHRERIELTVDPGDFVYVFLGRLTSDKGIDDLIDAFQVVRADRDNQRLLLVGDIEGSTEERQRLIARIECAPGVLHHGYRTDVREVLSSCDCLVLPSYREGLPNVLLEAAALALPVIASNATGVRDIVEDQRTGLIVPVHDTGLLAAAMRDVRDAYPQARARAERARAHVSLRFERTAVWNHWLTFFIGLTPIDALSRATITGSDAGCLPSVDAPGSTIGTRIGTCR
jgi:glycosyltransferase involved in cell wall biosynthesis